MARSPQTFEKRRRELEKKQKKEAKRLKKEAKKNGEYEPLPEIYVAEEEVSPTES
ncbi:MAG: hypothetical protein P8Y65_00935 [Campylobacterales bacterium]|jgi:hypothetical protein